jgi:hypothetical protein
MNEFIHLQKVFFPARHIDTYKKAFAKRLQSSAPSWHAGYKTTDSGCGCSPPHHQCRPK